MANDSALLSQLLAIDDLEVAQVHVDQSENSDALREALVEAFHSVAEYNDASEWERAVRLCEWLALVGWEPWERVDAFAKYNGDCWQTGFFTDRDDRRYRHGRWTKRKAGWALFNPEYHFSPDRPDVPAKDWKQHGRRKYAPVDVGRLTTQRNYLRRMPFSLSVIQGQEPDVARAGHLRRELVEHLTDSMMRPAYGEALEHFYIQLHLGTDPARALTVGTFRPKERAFSCDLGVPIGFIGMSPTAQKEFFRDAFVAGIDALRAKLSATDLPFDFETFTADVESAFNAWLRQGTLD